MDLWEPMELAGVTKLREAVARDRIDREELSRALQLIAMGKNHDSNAGKISFASLDNRELKGIAEAILTGYPQAP
jgi:hypothetical protein